MSDFNALLASGPLRIGLMTHSLNPRGGVVHTLELAHALLDAGHTVTVMAPALPGQQFFRPVRCRTELVPVADTPTDMAEMVGSRIAAYTAHLRGLLDREHFDILHTHDGIGGNALANLQDEGWRGSFVRTVHHLDTFDSPQIQRWQLRGFKRARSVLCVSKLWCDVLRRDHHIHATEVHNGVDTARYNATPQPADAEVASRLGLQCHANGAGPMVLAVGGIEERKNTVRLLEAFVLLRKQRPSAQLVVAGGVSLLNHDAYVQRFHALLAQHGLTTGPHQPVVLTGGVRDADMPGLFRLADVVAMPSTREGFGLVVLESLASGTPVVVSNIAPFTQYLNGGDCHWADPLSAASIASALAAALRAGKSPALAGIASRLGQRFSWDSSAQLHLNAYRRTLNHAAPETLTCDV